MNFLESLLATFQDAVDTAHDDDEKLNALMAQQMASVIVKLFNDPTIMKPTMEETLDAHSKKVAAGLKGCAVAMACLGVFAAPSGGKDRREKIYAMVAREAEECAEIIHQRGMKVAQEALETWGKMFEARTKQ